MRSSSAARGDLVRLPSSQSNEALVLRTLEGDRWAADALYRRHGRDVYRVATLLLGRSAEVDDVVQDAFVKAFQSLATLRDRSAFGGWVVRIAAHTARSRLRRRGLMRRLGLDRGEEDQSFEELAAAELSVEERAELSRVGEVMRAFPAEVRVAWTLRRVEGWPLQEIADTVNASLATVKRRVDAGDEKLRAHVEGGRS